MQLVPNALPRRSQNGKSKCLTCAWTHSFFVVHGSPGAISKLTFGGDGESGNIKKADCSGESFDVGETVQYQGKQCTVSKAVDSNGYLKVKFPPTTLETSMMGADLSGLNLGVAGAIIAAAFIPKW